MRIEITGSNIAVTGQFNRSFLMEDGLRRLRYHPLQGGDRTVLQKTKAWNSVLSTWTMGRHFDGSWWLSGYWGHWSQAQPRMGAYRLAVLKIPSREWADILMKHGSGQRRYQPLQWADTGMRRVGLPKQGTVGRHIDGGWLWLRRCRGYCSQAQPRMGAAKQQRWHKHSLFCLGHCKLRP